jgi:hypothetical protein
MSTPNSLSSPRTFALFAAVAAAALGTFGCASAVDASEPSGDVATTTDPSRTTRPELRGDACAHPELGIYTNDADGGPANAVGGECHYDETHGYVVVTSIEEAGVGDYNCSMHPQRVAVTFYDASGNAVATEHLRNDYGANPPLHCLEREGIRVGAHFPAARSVLTAGTCSPVVLSIDADFPSCTTGCY